MAAGSYLPLVVGRGSAVVSVGHRSVWSSSLPHAAAASSKR